MSDFSYPTLKYPINGTFIVKNIITNSNKTIRIFDYPIPVGTQRDLLLVPGIDESDIRASLLKGTLRIKILAGEIEVIQSDIDLLQFNLNQKSFLQGAGVVNGLQTTTDQGFYLWKQDIMLIGAVNDVNTIFTIPDGIFINDTNHKIVVYKNGVRQVAGDDVMFSESGGVGTGYNTIIFTVPPATTPLPIDVLTTDYYIRNA